MKILNSALAFIEGIKSAIDVSGIIQSSISAALSNGIEGAFKRIRKPLEQSLMRIACTLVSVFLIVWGMALFLDNFVPYHGLGFVIVGAFFGIMVLVFLKENEAG